MEPVAGGSAPDGAAAEFLAVVVADHGVDIAARVEGRLESVAVRLGDRVGAGVVVAVVAAEGANRAVAEAQAESTEARFFLRRAELKLVEAQERSQRSRRLADLSSKQDLRQRELDLEVAEAELAAQRARTQGLEARVNRLRVQLADSSLQAPFPGRIAARYQEPGAFVSRGTPIVRLVSSEVRWVRFAVPAKRAQGLEVGDRIAFRTDSSPAFTHGQVRHVAPEIDAASQMVFAEAVIEEPALDVQPGQVGRVLLVGPDAVPHQGGDRVPPTL